MVARKARTESTRKRTKTRTLAARALVRCGGASSGGEYGFELSVATSEILVRDRLKKIGERTSGW